MSRLSIVYVWDADYPWDVRTEKIALALTEAGHDVTIVARNRAWKPTREILKEGVVRRMEPWRAIGRAADGLLSFPAFFNPRWVTLLRTAVRESKADLIMVRDLPLCPTAIAVGRWEGIPVALDMAENYPAMMRDRQKGARNAFIDAFARNPRVTDLVEKYCIRRAAWIFTVVEESSARIIHLGANPARVSVVSNTPPRARAERARDKVRSEPDGTTIVYLGLLEVARGINELIDAIGILRTEYAMDVRATIVGSGRDSELFAAHSTKLGLDGSIEFLGYLPNREALQVIAKGDVGVIPHQATDSWNTTIPNKLFDYMAAGMPVVTSDTPPCARIVNETGCGEIFRAGDGRSLAEAIRRVTDPGARERFGKAGREAVRSRYNQETDSVALLEGIRQLHKAVSRH